MNGISRDKLRTLLTAHHATSTTRMRKEELLDLAKQVCDAQCTTHAHLWTTSVQSTPTPANPIPLVDGLQDVAPSTVKKPTVVAKRKLAVALQTSGEATGRVSPSMLESVAEMKRMAAKHVLDARTKALPVTAPSTEVVDEDGVKRRKVSDPLQPPPPHQPRVQAVNWCIENVLHDMRTMPYAEQRQCLAHLRLLTSEFEEAFPVLCLPVIDTVEVGGSVVADDGVNVPPMESFIAADPVTTEDMDTMLRQICADAAATPGNGTLTAEDMVQLVRRTCLLLA